MKWKNDAANRVADTSMLPYIYMCIEDEVTCSFNNNITGYYSTDYGFLLTLHHPLLLLLCFPFFFPSIVLSLLPGSIFIFDLKIYLSYFYLQYRTFYFWKTKKDVWDTCCFGLFWWLSGQKVSSAWALSQEILSRLSISYIFAFIFIQAPLKYINGYLLFFNVYSIVPVLASL
jgi:hypothetical protein